MLEEIRKKVQEKVNQSHKQIVLGVYQRMVNAHNTLCGCNYCILLKEYILRKKHLSRYKRRVGQEWYHNGDPKIFTPEVEQEEMNNIFRLKEMITKLKYQKDKLKIVP